MSKPLFKLKERMPPIIAGGEPTREPVNRQAALVTRRASWLERPLPPERPPVGAFDRMKSELDELKGTTRSQKAEIVALRRRVSLLQQDVDREKQRVADAVALAEAHLKNCSESERAGKEKLMKKLKAFSLIIDT